MTRSPSPSAESLDRPELPRFGLRTLFGGVSLICLMLAVFVGAGPLLAAGILLGTLILVAHLAAAFIGHRMLDRAAFTRRGAHFSSDISGGRDAGRVEDAATPSPAGASPWAVERTRILAPFSPGFAGEKGGG